jgi:hypothetical protein
VLAHQLDRVGVRRVVLLVLGRDDLEGDRELLEDRPTLRARRGEQEGVDAVRAQTSSSSANQSAISRCADSGESEPWMRLFGIEVA